MSLKWTDVLEIAIQLAESKPDIDPISVNFVDLRKWVIQLPEFDDKAGVRRQTGTLWREDSGGHPGPLDRRTRLIRSSNTRVRQYPRTRV